MVESFCFSGIHSLGELQGNILNILRQRVKRRLENDLLEWAVYLESQALQTRFSIDPYAHESHSRGQAAWLMQMKKVERPDISYLQYLLKSLLDAE